MPNQPATYSAAIMDHFLHPRNAGMLATPTLRVAVTNELCGDEMTMTINLRDGRISEARFQSFGCAVAIATASMLTEAITGKTLGEADVVAAAVFATIERDTRGEKEHCRSMVRRIWERAAEQMRRLS